jgi:hypothetical protein
MSIIFGIMKEEYDRLIEAEEAYRKSVEKAVPGAPRIKHIGNRDYLYLERREGKKVIDKYIGPADSEKAKAIMNEINQRRKDMESLKRIKKDLKDVKKVLRGKI